jgi:hypothetical protein
MEYWSRDAETAIRGGELARCGDRREKEFHAKHAKKARIAKERFE